MSLSWEFPYPSQRMPVFARNLVCSSQPLAAQAGLQMLQKGGNAVDAALATGLEIRMTGEKGTAQKPPSLSSTMPSKSSISSNFS